MGTKRVGKYTVQFSNPPIIRGYASVAGKKEMEGSFGELFDYTSDDTTFGEDSWEKAESFMQKKSLAIALEKAGLSVGEIEYIFAGDLLNQCISSSFAHRESQRPFVGLYGACSTMAESIMMGSMAIDGGFASYVAAITSSHYCSAERQYRLPLSYGGQRTPTAQWTATGSGSVILSTQGSGVKVVRATAGKIVDFGITDPNNMGAAMAPSAHETLTLFFKDTGTKPDDYDLIVTGDLGIVGADILRELMSKSGITLGKNYNDCGVMLFNEEQDTHAGGSGCGCSAIILCSHILNEMSSKKLKKVIFAGTGALLSPVSSGQGESIPGVCHLIELNA